MIKWKVKISRNAAKQLSKLDESIIVVFRLLVCELELNGPFPGKGWRNYSKLKTRQTVDKRHCHLLSGKPT